MDFISGAPVPVAKLILSLVGVEEVWGARLVSRRWYVLVKELLAEHAQFQAHVFRCRALRPMALLHGEPLRKEKKKFLEKNISKKCNFSF